jgi:hypothetical protein
MRHVAMCPVEDVAGQTRLVNGPQFDSGFAPTSEWFSTKGSLACPVNAMAADLVVATLALLESVALRVSKCTCALREIPGSQWSGRDTCNAGDPLNTPLFLTPLWRFRDEAR